MQNKKQKTMTLSQLVSLIEKKDNIAVDLYKKGELQWQDINENDTGFILTEIAKSRIDEVQIDFWNPLGAKDANMVDPKEAILSGRYNLKI